MNVDDMVERKYGIACMDPEDILNFGHTPLVMKLINCSILNDIAAEPRVRTLEIGSGTCHGSYLVKARYPDKNFVVATDVSWLGLVAGRKLERVFGSSLDGIVCCDATRLPFRNGVFDQAFGTAVLHHIQHPSDACLELRRVLSDEGKYLGIEGAVSRILRPLVRIFTGAQYRIQSEGVREDIYDTESWRKVFAQAGMRATVEPLIQPHAYKELISAKIIPKSYRPRYKLRYLYERILSVLPPSFRKNLIETLLPATILIRAK